MQERRITFSINLSFMLYAAAVAVMHLGLMFVNVKDKFDLENIVDTHRQVLTVRQMENEDLKKVRKIGEKAGKGLNQVLVNKGVKNGAERAKPNPFAAVAPRPHTPPQKATQKNPYRPVNRAKALEQLALKAEPVKEVAARTQHGGAAALSGSPTLSKSLMNMQVEVPEGVAVDELNEFELQFYGFQKRLVSKYLNSIELQVREYEKRFSTQTLGVAGKHTMTGRVTFDSEGNIKQIKMVRWTQADKLQSLFEDILKSMIALPNPPKMLRNTNGEFVVFYTLTVDNG